ncbi:GNAT family N-acetyltransferase [candidate division KSB1 bacterium]|nr:GNAT family N-acetyltransferase [candidate division KSB1 bacterium]
MLETTWKIRFATQTDVPFLREMLYEAVCWRPHQPRPPLEEVLAEPELAKLLSGWGRNGDTAVVAEWEDGMPVGAAWYRSWMAENHSYGFVDADTPELGIAVRQEFRQRGIGTALLTALLQQARRSAIARISLSVEPENYSRALYEKLGFKRVGTSGTSLTMLLELR